MPITVKKYPWLGTVVSIVILVALGLSIFLLRKDVPLAQSVTPEVLPPIKIAEVPLGVLLGKAQLSFAGGSEERNHNIELGVARLSGTVVMPGEEFSFTKALGPVTKEDGFLDARVFLKNEVSLGLGGGLCQVSTILFQSLVNAGLPITERHNHTFSVIYYDVGLDATYSDPGPDLKFINDTGHALTIIGKTKEQKAIFEIYGTPDGRIASTSEALITDVVDFPPTRYVATSTPVVSPECVNVPQIGYTAKILYSILYPSGELKEQTFESTYQPLQRTCYLTPTSPLPDFTRF